MASINKVFLMGRLGKDPEGRTFDNGTKMCSFSMATSETWKDKVTGEKKEKTEWHNVVAFGATAGVILNYVKKGHLLHVIGKITTRSWDGNDGVKRYMTEIVAEEIQLMEKRDPNSSAPASVYASQYSRPANDPTGPNAPGPHNSGNNGGTNVDPFSAPQTTDDLPF